MLIRTLLAVLATGFAVAAAAQDYPARPVRIVVPAATGTVDILARTVAQKLSEGLGQNVVVENRPGASTNLGTELVARAKPDGYTLLMNGLPLATNPILFEKLPFDPQKDLAPISLVASAANVLVVHPDVPARSVAELVALAKAQPGTLNFGIPAVGSTGHLAGEMFNALAGVKMTAVAYKGSGPALIDLLAGTIQMTFDNIPAALPHIKAGKLRPLGVTSATRAAQLPDVPTIAEAGLPGYEMTGWFGLLAPAGTPREVIIRLNAETVKALGTPELRERFATLGFGPLGGTPEAFAAYIRSEADRLGQVIRAAGVKAQ